MFCNRRDPIYLPADMPSDPSQKPKPATRSTEENMLGLIWVMEWSLALGFGVLAAATAGVTKLWEDHSMTFSIWVILAPAAVVTVNWLFWRHVKRKIAREGLKIRRQK